MEYGLVNANIGTFEVYDGLGWVQALPGQLRMLERNK
jgi:hypothetical protein